MSLALLSDDALEELVERVRTGEVTDYHLLPAAVKGERYVSPRGYVQHLRDALRRPVITFVAAAVIGITTLGAYFPSSNQILINQEPPAYASRLYDVIRHEENHARNPHRADNLRENEIANRQATERETGDYSQTQGLSYL